MAHVGRLACRARMFALLSFCSICDVYMVVHLFGSVGAIGEEDHQPLDAPGPAQQLDRMGKGVGDREDRPGAG